MDMDMDMFALVWTKAAVVVVVLDDSSSRSLIDARIFRDADQITCVLSIESPSGPTDVVGIYH
jgi:hypothetical protein